MSIILLILLLSHGLQRVCVNLTAKRTDVKTYCDVACVVIYTPSSSIAADHHMSERATDSITTASLPTVMCPVSDTEPLPARLIASKQRLLNAKNVNSMFTHRTAVALC